MDELMCCPLCGGKNIIYSDKLVKGGYCRRGIISCNDCGLNVEYEALEQCYDENELIKKWNTRVGG